MTTDSYLTLHGPAEGEFKDRGSKFIAYAFPADSESAILEALETIKKEHFKARHHCYAWRLGMDEHHFRANDDGEPSGTAGRPILAQIDARQLTNTLVVVVRYFGGVLLGTSGLINAYREAAHEALQAAQIKEVVLYDEVTFDCAYARLPDLQQQAHTLEMAILKEEFSEKALVVIGIRKSETREKLLLLKARLYKTPPDEALTLPWPDGISVVD